MNPNEYSQCLKDAEKLITSKFIPAIDDIQERTVSNVLFKVLIEFDLMNEGELESMTRQDKMRKTKQVKSSLKSGLIVYYPKSSICIGLDETNGAGALSFYYNHHEKIMCNKATNNKIFLMKGYFHHES